ncbi:MAG: transcriptional repressor [Bacteroidetes bacterium RIFCSPLOWO2_12_FULL_31_6]|nr:MAG: transcriptional repressor [Bacteroidetes bacterium RIFCSPLOWO2_12_FULL_31_6]
MNFTTHLTTNNIKPSIQRIKIFEYLYNNKIHPTVDNIYTGLVNEIPTLSKTTVYNTLKLFIDNKIATTVTIEDNEVRYDAFLEEHAHFKCDECGSIYDVEIEVKDLKFKKLGDFKVDKTNIYLNGKCKKCLTK